MPRWDWTRDAQNFTAAPVWSSDPETGFGTNGLAFDSAFDGLQGGAVVDGALANLQLLFPNPHLLERGFNSPEQFNQGGNSYGSQYYDETAIEVLQSSENFLNFHVALEGTNPRASGIGLPGPHGTIHSVIGGDMSPTSNAPNDPIFYLHHGNVDYLWAKWQDANPQTRLTDYTGNTVQGRNVNNAKLTDRLRFLGLGTDLQVQQVMNTRAFPYCYEYE